MIKPYLICLASMMVFSLQAQENISQTIRGQVIDTDGKYPLTGVTVLLANEGLEELVGTTTGQNGEFRLENVPLGRHQYPQSQSLSIRIALFEQVQHIHIDIPLAGNRHLGVGKAGHIRKGAEFRSNPQDAFLL